MPGRPALSSDAASSRLLVLDDGGAHDVFEVLEVSPHLLRVRSALLFEVGEELSVRLEQDGRSAEVTVRVRAHGGPADAPITELEVSERAEAEAEQG